MNTTRELPASRRWAFTLIELLVTMAILAVLAGLILAGVQRVRMAAARSSCANNLRQLGLAAQQYHGDRGRLPRGAGVYGQSISWHASLLPYLEQAALWQATKAEYDANAGWGEFTAGQTVVKVLVCPGDGVTQSVQRNKLGNPFTETNYLGNWGVSRGRGESATGPDKPADGVLFERSRVRFADITDGTSNTILAGERPSGEAAVGVWYSGAGFGTAFIGVEEWVKFDDYRPELGRKLCPDPIVFGPGRRGNPCDLLHFWSYHDAGGNFAFCDGSVRFVAYSGRAILPPLATRAAGDAVSSAE